MSMNPHFRKGNKAKHGSGHLWVLADIEEADQQVLPQATPVQPTVQIPKVIFGKFDPYLNRRSFRLVYVHFCVCFRPIALSVLLWSILI